MYSVFMRTKFGERLKELRTEKNLSQRDLAVILQTSQSSINRWENDLQEPCLEMLAKIVIFFEVSVNYILGVED